MSTQQSSADAGADEALLRLQAAGFTPWAGRRPEELKGRNLEYLLGGGQIIAARLIPIESEVAPC